MVLSLLVCLHVDPALAGEAEAAEHARLGEELVRLVQRSQWPGAARTYQSLVALESVGESLTFDEVHLGAQVAQAVGDMTACRGRLERAWSMAPSVEIATWMRAIEGTYAPVRLVAPGAGAAQLEPAEMPFEPDRRTAIQTAQVFLARTGSFEGLLPRGTYTFGGRSLVVAPEVTAQVMNLAAVVPEPRVETRPAALRPRVSVAGAWTHATAPSDPAQPPAFGGAGARVAAGAAWDVTPAFAVVTDLGYHGLVDPEPDALRDNALHLGFMAVGAGWRVGRLRLVAEAEVGAGPMQATGLADADAADLTVEGVEWVWTGTVVASGATVSGAWKVAELGPLDLALGAGGGVLADPSRAWPWGHLGIEVAAR